MMNNDAQNLQNYTYSVGGQEVQESEVLGN